VLKRLPGASWHDLELDSCNQLSPGLDRFNRHLDGIHATALNTDSGQLEGVTEFEDEIDRNLSGRAEDLDEVKYSISDVGSAGYAILEWLASPSNLEYIASRVLALHFYLRLENSDFSSISEIALAPGCTKESISKSLVECRDSIDFGLVAGKLDGTREAYAKAQKAAVRAGCTFRFCPERCEATESQVRCRKSGISGNQ
jgi:hypothetical protein